MLAVLSAALGALSIGRDGIGLSVLGYACGALGAAVLLPLYRSLSQSRHGRTFRPNRRLDRLALALAVLSLAAGLYCGYLAATELAK